MSLKQPLLSKHHDVQKENIDEDDDDSIYYENRSKTDFQYTLHGVQRKEPLPVVVDKKSKVSESDYLLGKSANSATSYMTNISTVHNASDALQQALNYRNSFITAQQQTLKEIESFVSSLKSEIAQLKDKNKALESELSECKKTQNTGCGKRHVFCTVAFTIPLLILVALFIILIVIFGKDIFCKVQS